MSWTAFFQADGELRHTIAVRKFKHSADFAAEEFVKRMTHPEVGLWWTWSEETGDDDGEENNEAKALIETSGDVNADVPDKVADILDVLKVAIGPYGAFPF